MIWIHEPSIGSEQNLERKVVVRLEDSFILKHEDYLDEFDVVDVDNWEYIEWTSNGNTPEIWSPDGN